MGIDKPALRAYVNSVLADFQYRQITAEQAKAKVAHKIWEMTGRNDAQANWYEAVRELFFRVGM